MTDLAEADMAGLPCPCGAGPILAECCLPVIAGNAAAESALALMRSRYTAYVLGKVDYLNISWHPDTRPESLVLASGVAWQRLEVLSTKVGMASDVKGSVEFIAHYTTAEGSGQVHENSRFVREGGVWLYLDGDLKTASTPGRNHPCPCGSGNKFKKCCGR